MNTSTNEPAPAGGIVYKPKDPWRRLVFAVVVHGLMECEPRYNKLNTSHCNRTLTQQRLAAGAQAWVNGPEFKRFCAFLGLNPVRMRRYTPDQAKVLWKVIEGDPYYRQFQCEARAA